jgi:hypothetical protein
MRWFRDHRWTSVAFLALVGLSAAPPGRAVRAEAEPPDAALFVGGERSFAELTAALSHNEAVSMKPVGSTSVVFKLDLKGSIDAAFKPATRLHPDGHRAEVAAYRLGRALALPNVTPAVLRGFTTQELQHLLRGRYQERWPELESGMLAQSGNVMGALIYWIPDLHELGIDHDAGIDRWARWLSQEGGELPERDKLRGLAGQVSTMVTFDYLIANWDRFSGANAQGDHSESFLFLRDHNVAFGEPLSATHQSRLLLRLRRVQRFSRGFIQQLKHKDAAALRSLAEGGGPELLRPAQWAGLSQRRLTVLSYVAALIDRFGEQQVLSLP